MQYGRAIAKKYLKQEYGVLVRGYLKQMGEITIETVDWGEVAENPFFVLIRARSVRWRR